MLAIALVGLYFQYRNSQHIQEWYNRVMGGAAAADTPPPASGAGMIN